MNTTVIIWAYAILAVISMMWFVFEKKAYKKSFSRIDIIVISAKGLWSGFKALAWPCLGPVIAIAMHSGGQPWSYSLLGGFMAFGVSMVVGGTLQCL